MKSKEEIQKINQQIIKHISLIKDGFENPVIFVDNHVGFSIQKKNRNADGVTLIKVYIPDDKLNDDSINIKPIYISAIYGKKTDDGVKMRSKVKLFEPVDIGNNEDYFFDINNDIFYDNKHKKEINKIIKIYYRKHVFWSVIDRFVNFVILSFLQLTLLVIAGVRYKIEWPNFDIKQDAYQIYAPKLKFEYIDSEKFDFYGIKVRRQSLIFYSFLHLLILFTKNLKISTFFTNIFNNAFVSLMYIIFSISIIEIYIPKILIFIINHIYSKKGETFYINN